MNLLFEKAINAIQAVSNLPEWPLCRLYSDLCLSNYSQVFIAGRIILPDHVVMSTDDEFEPKLGHSPRDRILDGPLSRQLMHRIGRAYGNPHRLPRLLPHVPTVKPRSGRFNARGRGAWIAASLPRSSNWSFDTLSGFQVRPRRIYVLHHIVRPSGSIRATYKHLCYLEREGVQRDGSSGRLFSTFTDEASRGDFLSRTHGDPHQFRLILAPEHTGTYEDLKPFARDVLARVEMDLDTNLDWVAVEHYDNGHPHVHVVIRGVTEDGRALNIAGDYLQYGVAHRASEVLTRDLGLEKATDIERHIEREVEADRLTRLDRMLMDRAENGVVDLRRESFARDFDPTLQQQLIARMRRLERMRLATRDRPLQWRLSPNLGDVLEDMGEQAVRLSAVHRAVTEANLGRSPELYTFHHRPDDPVMGSIVACGRAFGQQDRNYIVLDGADGRTHYFDIGIEPAKFSIGSIVRVSPHRTGPRRADQTIANIASMNGDRYDVERHLRSDSAATIGAAEAHARRLAAISRAVGGIDREPDGSWKIGPDYMDRVRAYEGRLAEARPVVVETLSKLSLAQQINAEGTTWLDRQLTGEIKPGHSHYGFGREVDEALRRRQQWLIEQGFARWDGDRVVYPTDLPNSLRMREVMQQARKLEGELHKPFGQPAPYERIEGTFRQTLELTSGRFALIEKSYEFVLVPWKPELERCLGKAISGIPFEGNYEWTLGRGRGLSR